MKYTGWAVLVIGVLIGVFGLFLMFPSTPAQVPPADAPQVQAVPFGPILLGFSAVAIAGGLGILLLGGRGVIKTKNLAVRN